MIRRTLGRPWLKAVLCLFLGLTFIWMLWTEARPGQERWLRNEAQNRLQVWFPGPMTAPEREAGFTALPEPTPSRPLIVLIHGLDEPGGIFEELGLALNQADYRWTEFRYPNDQAIDRSADLLLAHWDQLPSTQAVVLVGHSMGGLVLRDFVTRLSTATDQRQARVVRALLIGTPNQGSDWARLRVWLELRDRFGRHEDTDYSLFAGLRDGTGAAKIDLRPGSRFLRQLNDRPWPDAIPLRILGGQLTGQLDRQDLDLNGLSDAIGDADWADRFGVWLKASASQLGDGVVAINALPAPGAPPPEVVEASHRGLLVRGPLTDAQPPGIDWVLRQLEMVEIAP